MNLIYKLGIAIVMLIVALTGKGQSKSYNIYDAYGNEDGFSYFSFSKTMLDAVDLNLDDENKKVTGDFHELRVMVYNPEKGKLNADFRKEMSQRLNKMNYKKVEPKDEDSNDDVEFWIEGQGKKVKECHVIVESKEKNGYGCLVSFYGDFTVEDIDKLEAFSKKQLE
jgi:hypothetical protein